MLFHFSRIECHVLVLLAPTNWSKLPHKFHNFERNCSYLLYNRFTNYQEFSHHGELFFNLNQKLFLYASSSYFAHQAELCTLHIWVQSITHNCRKLLSIYHICHTSHHQITSVHNINWVTSWPRSEHNLSTYDLENSIHSLFTPV